MSVRKKNKTILACTCEHPDCGKSWESQGSKIPIQCRWCFRRTWNGQDKRSHLVTAQGKTQRISEWARETGIGKATIRARLQLGWSDEEALGFKERKKR